MPSRDESPIYPSHPPSSSSPSSSTPQQQQQPHLLSALVAQSSSSTTTSTSSSQDTLDLLQTTQRLIDSLSEFGSSVSLRVEGIERSLARLRSTLADIRASQENRIAPPSRRRPADQDPPQTGNMSRSGVHPSEPVIDGPLSTRARACPPKPAVDSTEYTWALRNSRFPRAVHGMPVVPEQGSLMAEYTWGYIDIYDVWQSGTEVKWPLPTDPRRTALLPRTIPPAPARVGTGQWRALHVLKYRLEDLTTAWSNRGHLITLPHPFISFTEAHMLEIGRALSAYQVFSTPSRPASEGNNALVELYQSCAAAYISLFASILSEGFCNNPSIMFDTSRNVKVDGKKRAVQKECAFEVQKALNCFNVVRYYVSPPEASLGKDHPLRQGWRKREWRLMPGVSRSMEQDQISKMLDDVDREVHAIEAGIRLRPTNLREQAKAPRPMIVSSERPNRPTTSPSPSSFPLLPLWPTLPDYLSRNVHRPVNRTAPSSFWSRHSVRDLDTFLAAARPRDRAHPLPPSGSSSSRPGRSRATDFEESLTRIGAMVEERMDAMLSEDPPTPAAAGDGDSPEPHPFTSVSLAEMLHEPPPPTTARRGHEDPQWARRTAQAIADVAREVADRTAYHDRAEFRERPITGPPAPLRLPALDLRATFDPGPSPSSPTVAGTPTLELMNQIQRRANAARASAAAAVASGSNAGAAPSSRAARRAELQASLALIRGFSPLPSLSYPDGASQSSRPPNPSADRLPFPASIGTSSRDPYEHWLPQDDDPGIGSGSEGSDSVEDGDSDEDEDDDDDSYGEDDGTASEAGSEEDDDEEDEEEEQEHRVPAMPDLRGWGGVDTDDLEAETYFRHLRRTVGPNQFRGSPAPTTEQLIDAFEHPHPPPAVDPDAGADLRYGDQVLDAMSFNLRRRMLSSAGAAWATASATATATATPGLVPGPSNTRASETETRQSRLDTGDGRMWADPYSTASEELDRLPIYPRAAATDAEFMAQVAQHRREMRNQTARGTLGHRAETGNDDK